MILSTTASRSDIGAAWVPGMQQVRSRVAARINPQHRLLCDHLRQAGSARGCRVHLRAAAPRHQGSDPTGLAFESPVWCKPS